MKEKKEEKFKAKVGDETHTVKIATEKEGDTVRILINPPPMDKCCECCRKHIHDLKPFGKAGDPLVGDFDGQYLVKTFRGMGPRNDEYEKIMAEIEVEIKGDWEKFEELLIKRVGPKKAERIMFYDQIVSTVGASWECRDCIILDSKDYHKKLNERWKKKEQ